MDVNYELYKVFYFVATTLSFSDASKQLYISQSAVSQSIKTLEKKLNQHLFIRSTKKVQLTPEGEVLFKHIEPAVNLIIRGENNLMETHTLNGGQLRIGASDTICRYFLVPYLKKFHSKYPNIKLKIINQSSVECVKLLENGSVDFIISNYPNKFLKDFIGTITVKEFNDKFIAGTSYSNLKNMPLTLLDIQKYPLIMLNQDSTTNEFLQSIYKEYNFEFSPEIELSSNDLLIDLASIGLGIAFIPDYCLPRQIQNFFILNMQDKIPSRRLVVAYSNQIPLSQASQAFINLLTKKNHKQDTFKFL